MTRSTRSIEMDDDDLEAIDTNGPYSTIILENRCFQAVYEARPAMAVTLPWGQFSVIDGRWCYPSGERITLNCSFDQALHRIWELEHPDKETEQ